MEGFLYQVNFITFARPVSCGSGGEMNDVDERRKEVSAGGSLGDG